LESLWHELAKSAAPFKVDSDVSTQALGALRSAYPSEADTILALLAWFGQGKGPWSGYPSYEGIPETLLLDFSTAAIVRALESRERTPHELAASGPTRAC
jgi:hypothetical protein